MQNDKYIFDRPITEIIKARSSVRTYQNKPISKDTKDKLNFMLADLKGPLGVKVRLKLVDSDILKQEADIKLGTYGVIKGASSFMISAVEKDGTSVEEVGYMFEKAVLYATSLGLGTCWLGGTFSRGEFAKAVALKENEIIPAVTPIGYASDNRSFLESFMRFAAGSKNRKGWDELFFVNDFSSKLRKEDADKYADALEMVRLGPSASNKQPWRILRGKNEHHFYLQHAKAYSNALSFDIQRLDIGIAMCHFEMTVREAGIKGNWRIADPQIKNIPEGAEYIVSWIEE